MTYYTHERLPPGRWIRLLRLLPGSFEDKISCELIQTEFEKAASFEPISYSWGSRADKREISCHGRLLLITVNLFQALRCFRLGKEPRLVWADGICIDQTSVEERGHQVSFMDQVYARGACTLIWLGESPDHIDIEGGIGLMRDFNRHMEMEIDTMDKHDHEDIWETIHSVPPLPDNHPLVTCENRWGGIRELLGRPYFRRVWVMQELGLSGNAEAFCGNYRIKFSEIISFVAYYSHMQKFMGCRGIPWTHIDNALQDIWSTYGSLESWLNDRGPLEKIKAYYQERNDNGLLDILDTSRGFEATLDVDHIYAFLGHPLGRSEDGTKYLIEVDYKRTVQETSVLVAEQICVTSLSRSLHPLALLCHVVHPDDGDSEYLDSSRSRIPSWVPTWHESKLYNYLNPHLSADASLQKQTWSRNRTMAVFKGENWQQKQLVVAALLLGQVTKCSGSLPDDPEKVHDTVRQCWEIYSTAPNLVQTRPRYWQNFLWNLVRTYPLPDLLPFDFVAFCRQRSLDFFQLISTRSYFSRALHSSPNTSPDRFIDEANSVCGNKKFFATIRGFCGMGLQSTRENDVLAIIFGCPMPVLLRPTSDPRIYSLVGQAYVQELMYGKAVRDWKNGKLQTDIQEISIG
ncbi:uncharacterized protein PAC_15285 [Phialocephala subalpina]|uniref:Heterokaryon incompatibility domain-containing protein n=1 Tax=Phialocephala subalpina TaxID=576137 RepID=A0A1L7XJZ7_9HELO|nr:uncharacterized protein PAC_15285 [Phialocephala subalpina]